LLFSVFSCEEIIEVDDISDETITILAPTNNATLETDTISFSWEPIEYGDSYQLQIALPDFETAQQIIVDTLITTSSHIKTLPADEYQWRIKAINSAYETQFTTQNFTVEE
jgi:hypothetical protein